MNDAERLVQIVISIHAPREGGDETTVYKGQENTISIHAPREGGDHYLFRYPWMIHISIHAPREGGDCPSV